MSFVTDIQFQQHADLVREEFKNRQILLSGPGAPGSLKAPVGAYYLDINNNDRYEKVGSLDTDWQLYTSENAEGAWQYVSADFTAVKDNKYMVDTTPVGSPAVPITVTLPLSATAGDVIWFVDYAGTFADNNLVIDPNGLNIMGGATPFEVNVSDVMFMIMYKNVTTGWKIYPVSN